MSTCHVCDICGKPLPEGHTGKIIIDWEEGGKYRDDDARFKETKHMEVHINCAVDAKNAVLNLRKAYS